MSVLTKCNTLNRVLKGTIHTCPLALVFSRQPPHSRLHSVLKRVGCAVSQHLKGTNIGNVRRGWYVATLPGQAAPVGGPNVPIGQDEAFYIIGIRIKGLTGPVRVGQPLSCQVQIGCNVSDGSTDSWF